MIFKDSVELIELFKALHSDVIVVELRKLLCFENKTHGIRVKPLLGLIFEMIDIFGSDT
jgi:hypothetical protein